MQHKSLNSIKQLKHLLLPDITLIHRQWLRELVPDGWLNKCLSSGHALNLLSKKFHTHYSIPMPDTTVLEPCQQWLLLDIDDQNQLAITVGSRVCSRLIRSIVKKNQVTMLVDQLGSDFYLSVLNSHEISAKGVNEVEFHEHMIEEQLCLFLTAVGISALQQTIDVDSEFFRLRIKFTFPKYCWKIRPVLSELDMQALMLLLSETAVLSGEGENNA